MIELKKRQNIKYKRIIQLIKPLKSAYHRIKSIYQVGTNYKHFARVIARN